MNCGKKSRGELKVAGASRKNASDTDKSVGSTQDSSEATGTSREARGGKARRGKACSEASPAVAQIADRSTGAGVVQALQARLDGHRGTHSERARHAFRLPVLPEVSPSPRTGARI